VAIAQTAPVVGQSEIAVDAITNDPGSGVETFQGTYAFKPGDRFIYVMVSRQLPLPGEPSWAFKAELDPGDRWTAVVNYGALGSGPFQMKATVIPLPGAGSSQSSVAASFPSTTPGQPTTTAAAGGAGGGSNDDAERAAVSALERGNFGVASAVSAPVTFP
jgi:hypothetical protein